MVQDLAKVGSRGGERSFLRRVAARTGFTRFRRDEHGAAAVEFAIVGPLFLFIVFAIFETASVYWVDRILMSYASDVARAARTGFTPTVTQNGPGGNPITRQKDLCADGVANLLFNCSNMMVDVRETRFATDQRGPNGEVDRNDLVNDPGASGSVNIVRVYYVWPRLFGLPLTPAGEPRHDGDVQLYAAVGFVKE